MSSVVKSALESDDIPLADEEGEDVADNDDQGLDDAGNMHGDQIMEHPLDYFDDGDQTSSAFSSLDHQSICDDSEEKARLVSQVLELQNTLDDLAQRVDSVKEGNLKLKSENQVLGQYIENLMSASSVFQSTQQTTPKPVKK